MERSGPEYGMNRNGAVSGVRPTERGVSDERKFPSLPLRSQALRLRLRMASTVNALACLFAYLLTYLLIY